MLKSISLKNRVTEVSNKFFYCLFYLFWWGKKLDSSTENGLELKQKWQHP